MRSGGLGNDATGVSGVWVPGVVGWGAQEMMGLGPMGCMSMLEVFRGDQGSGMQGTCPLGDGSGGLGDVQVLGSAGSTSIVGMPNWGSRDGMGSGAQGKVGVKAS